MMYDFDGIENLSNAIVEQAAKDYVSIGKEILKYKKRGTNTKYKETQLSDMKRWFLSEIFTIYSPNKNGSYYIRMLDEMILENKIIHRKRTTYEDRM